MSPDWPFKGVYFDGHAAGRHPVTVALTDRHDALIITGDHPGDQAIWPLEDIRLVSENRHFDELVVTIVAQTEDERPHDPARLKINDPDLIGWINSQCRNLNRRDLSGGTGFKIVKRLGMAAAALAVMLFVILPRMADTFANLIPIEREIAFGKSVVAQMERFLGGRSIGALHCDAPEGQAVLDILHARLTKNQNLTYNIELTVFDHPMVNAFAAPGGQVVVLRGLLDEASGPDAVTGVLAHEIGHVETRDATRLALRAAGSAGLLAMVLGDFAGGTAVVIIGEQFLSSAYSRTAEANADAFALDMLNRANVSSEGLAEFFEYIQTLDTPLDVPEYLASHPASDGRAALARRNAQTQYATHPSLTDVEWQALKAICD